jgi:hypothetical protein
VIAYLKVLAQYSLEEVEATIKLSVKIWQRFKLGSSQTQVRIMTTRVNLFSNLNTALNV